MSRVTVFRWDLDKTYLVSDYESLRSLIKVPFESARHKVAIPGVVPLIKALRRTGGQRRGAVRVYFLSASPPQIGRAIRDKLALDGIDYDGIVFKNQMRHIVRANFEALREQIGYKLVELLASARTVPAGAHEYLFGDDWESDPFAYSLYADVVAGRVDAARLIELLRRVGADRFYVDRIAELTAEPLPIYSVAGIFIVRQRKRSAADLAAFGRRIVWFDDYLECALRLHAIGLLDAPGVLEVADGGAFPRGSVAESFDLAARRSGRGGREALTVARTALLRANKLDPVPAGSVLRRLVVRVRIACGLTPAPVVDSDFVPDYEGLLASWSRRGRREAQREEETPRLEASHEIR